MIVISEEATGGSFGDLFRPICSTPMNSRILEIAIIMVSRGKPEMNVSSSLCNVVMLAGTYDW